ncbi:2Fe-2S iron-sulfur cluster-binding protein [Moraxella oblonga]|uniref:2Fe-2S iron-sulfur cluster-binding protein n=1 Tax=Moraxella oblonga TaxID=200413 RepID=UPI00082E499C|nr:2Fe-2S iron-sulfur cluster-binding protein [Moraxella oblonga]
MGWVFTEEKRFYLHDGETLLDGMIRTEHKDVRYMCRQGFCGACKIKVHSSTCATSHKSSPLAMLDDGEVLACCCVCDGTLAVCYEGRLSLFDDFIKNR